MKINTGSSIPQSEVEKMFELETSTKKDKRKSTQMEDQETEVKDRCKLFKWEWKL